MGGPVRLKSAIKDDCLVNLDGIGNLLLCVYMGLRECTSKYKHYNNTYLLIDVRGGRESVLVVLVVIVTRRWRVGPRSLRIESIHQDKREKE